MPLTYSDGSVCPIDAQARGPILSDKRKPCHIVAGQSVRAWEAYVPSAKTPAGPSYENLNLARKSRPRSAKRGL